MDFATADILQLTGNIWESMLGLPIAEDPAIPCGARPRAIVASIQIAGPWNGAIMLNCPSDAARRAASVMFSRDAGSVSVSDQQDAVAELVNMIGGHVKALLPQSCSLSLPTVVEGGDYSARIPGTRVCGAASFRCEDSQMSITIFERAAGAAA